MPATQMPADTLNRELQLARAAACEAFPLPRWHSAAARLFSQRQRKKLSLREDARGQRWTKHVAEATVTA